MRYIVALGTDPTVQVMKFHDKTMTHWESRSGNLPLAIACASTNRYVLCWADNDGRRVYQTFGKVYYSTLPEPMSEPEEISGATNVQIAMAKTGDFVVAWMEDVDDNDHYNVRARSVSFDGTTRYEKRLNTDVEGDQAYPHVALSPNGKGAAVWENDAEGKMAAMFGLTKFSVHHRALNPATRWDREDTMIVERGTNLGARVAIADDGREVVVWGGDPDENGRWQVYAVGFPRWLDYVQEHDDPTLGSFGPITVNKTSAGNQHTPAVGISRNGFVVAWEDDRDVNGWKNIYIRGFNNYGLQTFDERRVNTKTEGDQINPGIAMDGDGSFVVVWTDDQRHATPSQGRTVYARLYEPGGTPVGNPWNVMEDAAQSEGYDIQEYLADGIVVAASVEGGTVSPPYFISTSYTSPD
jgi:hypothetical protein